MPPQQLLQVRCPKCRHVMNYQANTPTLEGKSKRCVFCGRSFGVRKNMVKAL